MKSPENEWEKYFGEKYLVNWTRRIMESSNMEIMDFITPCQGFCESGQANSMWHFPNYNILPW
jgi:hypothetical protein